MARRRMFNLDIIDTDLFIEMPQSSRLLYYELCMRADDDGFVSSPKKIQRVVGCSDDDFKVLITKKFIIPFETGVVVIRHWKIHNYIQKDRYKETLYSEEKRLLSQEENGAYKLMDTSCIQNGDTGKDSIELVKDSIDNNIDINTDNNNKKERKKTSYDEILNSMIEDDDVKNTICDYIKMRKLIKKPMTDRAVTMLINKLFKLSNNKQIQIKILEQSILKNWTDIYPYKEENNYAVYQGNVETDLSKYDR